jgi:hypothetical protein
MRRRTHYWPTLASLCRSGGRGITAFLFFLPEIEKSIPARAYAMLLVMAPCDGCLQREPCLIRTALPALGPGVSGAGLTGRIPHRLSTGASDFQGNCSICRMTRVGGIEQAIVLEHGNEDAQEPIGHTPQGAGI